MKTINKLLLLTLLIAGSTYGCKDAESEEEPEPIEYPTEIILQSNPASIMAGEVVRVQASVEDLNEDITGHQWTVSGGTYDIVSTTPSGTAGFTAVIDWQSPIEEGTYEISLAVTTTSGGVTTETIEVTPGRGSAPTVTFSDLSEITTAGEIYRITASAADAEDDIESYDWTVGGGSVTVINDSIVDWQTPPTPGDFDVAVTVTDALGNQTTLTETVTLLSPPLEHTWELSESVQFGKVSTVQMWDRVFTMFSDGKGNTHLIKMDLEGNILFDKLYESINTATNLIKIGTDNTLLLVTDRWRYKLDIHGEILAKDGSTHYKEHEIYFQDPVATQGQTDQDIIQVWTEGASVWVARYDSEHLSQKQTIEKPIPDDKLPSEAKTSIAYDPNQDNVYISSNVSWHIWKLRIWIPFHQLTETTSYQQQEFWGELHPRVIRDNSTQDNALLHFRTTTALGMEINATDLEGRRLWNRPVDSYLPVGDKKNMKVWKSPASGNMYIYGQVRSREFPFNHFSYITKIDSGNDTNWTNVYDTESHPVAPYHFGNQVASVYELPNGKLVITGQTTRNNLPVFYIRVTGPDGKFD